MILKGEIRCLLNGVEQSLVASNVLTTELYSSTMLGLLHAFDDALILGLNSVTKLTVKIANV